MATYKGIKGVKVQSKASDPTASEADGTVWYNTTTSALKYAIQGAGAWASGGATNTGIDAGGYCGIQTAAMYFGGRGGAPITTAVDTSETYNGTAWTETGDLPTGVYQNAGFGTTTAAVSRGGMHTGNVPTTNTFEWDGTSWTAGGAGVNSSRNIHGTGTQTTGLTAGGSPGPYSLKSETYNGTAWAETNDLNLARWALPLVGTSTAALGVGGTMAPDNGATTTQDWDGTCWSTNPASLNEGKATAAAAGTTTAALQFGGYASGGTTTPTGATESYNGTTWTAVGSLGTARDSILGGQASANTAAIAFGGQIGTTVSTLTEEYNDPVYTIKTVTVS